jgi:hypothetical protein
MLLMTEMSTITGLWVVHMTQKSGNKTNVASLWIG